MLRQVARRFLALHELSLPLRADDALFAAGFFPVPSQGPASQDGNVVRYDETRPTWEAEVWSIVCTRLLEEADCATSPRMRAELARCLGVVTLETCSASYWTVGS